MLRGVKPGRTGEGLNVEPWHWLLAGVVAWYAVAAHQVRRSVIEIYKDGEVRDTIGEGFVRVLCWLFSPIIVPVMVVAYAAGLFGRYVLTPRR